MDLKVLPRSLFDSDDVVFLARALLGKGLFTDFGELTGGIIVETEAYAGVTDRASHAFGGRRTERNEVMYQQPGHAYVYLCYGIHYLFNIVTAGEGTPHAVLIRAVAPTHGIETMLKRRNKKCLDKTLCQGPGSAAAALGITRKHNGLALDQPPIVVCDLGIYPEKVIESTRIGVEYAGVDAKLPYRFQIEQPVFIGN